MSVGKSPEDSRQLGGETRTLAPPAGGLPARGWIGSLTCGS
jgi:hypothetical protein